MPIPKRNIVKMAAAAAAGRFFGVRKPLNVMIAVTDRCTGKCCYCAIPRRGSPDPPLDTLLEIIDQAADCGCSRFGIWGGEPLIREDIPEIIRRGKDRGAFVTVDTNGHLLADRIEEIRDADHLNISLDGDREAHDRLQGEGAFAKTMAGLARACGSIPCWTLTVLTRENIDQVDRLLAMARELGFRASFQLLHHNDKLGRNQGLYPDDGEVREAVQLILARKKEGAPVASSTRYLELLLEWPDYEKHRLPSRKGYPDCAAGKLYCNVDVNGRLYPCSLLIDEIDAPDSSILGFGGAFAALEAPPCNACIAACFTEYNLLFSLHLRTGLHWVKALKP